MTRHDNCLSSGRETMAIHAKRNKPAKLKRMALNDSGSKKEMAFWTTTNVAPQTNATASKLRSATVCCFNSIPPCLSVHI